MTAADDSTVQRAATMRPRVREISESIVRDGLSITLPQYTAPGDAIALGELLQAESSKPFEFHVRRASALVKRILKECFPNASVVTETSVTEPNVTEFAGRGIEWCEQNVERLRAYPGEFVAIDVAADAIVAHSASQSEFATALQKLDCGVAKRVFVTNTSRYV